MTNLTVTIDEEILRRARIRALEAGTSVNAVVRAFLEAYSGLNAHERALEAFAQVADRAAAGSGPAGRAWTRADLYE